MKNILLSIVCLVTMSFVNAQTHDHKLLECSGSIPTNLLTSSLEKNKTFQVSQEVLARSRKKDLKQYFLESDFVLDRLMQSGLVLFNDEVSVYLNKLAQRLLANETNELKDKINVYTLRSSEVNAFATQRGDVFVTMGLLSKLTSESAIAFILSHEITHVLKNHNLYSFIQISKVSKKSEQSTIRENGSIENKILEKCLFAKEQEAEADSIGTYRFINAGFDIGKVNEVFDALKYSNLPMSNAPFNFSLLESGTAELYDSLKTYKAKAILGINEEADDTKHSHPNLSKRRNMVSKILENQPTKAESKEAANKFRVIKERIEFEIPNLLLFEENEVEAIYVLSDLIKKYPNNAYLKKCFAKALYFIAQKINNNYNLSDAPKLTGNFEPVYNLFKSLSSEDINAVAMQGIWNISKQVNSDEMNLIVRNMEREFVRNVAAPEESGSAFWEQVYNSNLNNLRLVSVENLVPKNNFEKSNKKELRTKRKRLALGVKKVLLLNPDYISIDNRDQKTGVNYLKTEKKKGGLYDALKVASVKSKLDIEFLDASNLLASEVGKFNDIRHLNDWLRNKFSQPDFTDSVSINNEQVKRIAKKYGTNYILYTGVQSLRETNLAPILILPSLLVFPTTPYVLYKSFTPNYDMVFYSILVNVATNDVKIIKFNHFNRKETNTIMKAHLFDTFQQINRNPK